MRTLLLFSLLIGVALPARAQEMIEIPNDPNRPPPAQPPVATANDDVPLLIPTVPPPSPSLALPPPLIVAPPPLRPFRLDDPANYHRDINRPMAAAGGLVFAGLWTLNASGLAFGEGYLAIPLAGPIVEMEQLRSRDAQYGLQHSSSIDALLVLDTLAQAGSLALFVAGLTTHHTVFGRAVSVTPALTASSVGASLRF